MAQTTTERPPTVSKLCLMVWYLRTPFYSETHTSQIVIWLGVLFATVAVALRAFLRWRYSGRFQLDDVFTAFALALLIASAIMYIIAADPLFTMALVGSGQMYPPPEDFVETTELYLRLQFAITLAFWTCLWTVKASFLTLFFPLSNGLRWDRILWYIVATFVGIAYIVCVISYPISCSNFHLGKARASGMTEEGFIADIPIGGCDGESSVELSLVSLRMSTALDIISDAFIIILPWKLLWVVQRSRKGKLAIGSIVGLGVVIICFAIIRVTVTNTA